MRSVHQSDGLGDGFREAGLVGNTRRAGKAPFQLPQQLRVIVANEQSGDAAHALGNQDSPEGGVAIAETEDFGFCGISGHVRASLYVISTWSFAFVQTLRPLLSVVWWKPPLSRTVASLTYAIRSRPSWVNAVTPSSKPISSTILPFLSLRTVTPVKCISRPVFAGRPPARKSLKAGQ